jgi:hypothetical protein
VALRIPKSARIAVAAFALSALLGPTVAVARPHDHEVEVGEELMAIQDVTLHRAEILKGSRVSVTRVVQRDGRIDAIDVALADGHVVKLSLPVLRAAFRVVDE